MDELLTGTLVGKASMITWRGNTSLDWNQIKAFLYDTENEYDFWKTTDKWEYDKEIKQIDLSLMPFIKCSEVRNFSKEIFITAKSGIHVFLTDPSQQPDHRILSNGVTGSSVLVGSYGLPIGISEETVSHIKIILSKKRSSKTSCMNYIQPNSYAKCINTLV